MSTASRSEPLVSVLISVYNAGPYLRASVESILAQTHGALEIWVIDDGSTDGCMESLEGLDDARLHRVRQENSGKAAALNSLLPRISGDFYAIHDADDWSHPRRIELQVACMVDHPELAGCFTGYDLLIGERRVAPRSRAKNAEECARNIAHFSMPSHDPTAMFRVSMVRDFAYDAGLAIGQGYDYILRVGEQHPLMVIPDCLYSYRVHPDSNTRNDPARRESIVRQIRERACERRGLDAYASLGRASGAARRAASDNNLAAHFLESTLDLRRERRISEAFWTALFSARLRPLDPDYYKPLVCAAAPLPLLDRVRRSRRSA